MIELLLAATLLCPVDIPPGTRTMSVEARCQHEFPDGQLYVYRGNHQVLGPGQASINAEGHPYYVVGKINGTTVGQCSQTIAIFIDGFDSGTTEEWTTY